MYLVVHSPPPKAWLLKVWSSACEVELKEVLFSPHIIMGSKPTI